jgi:sortase A
MTARVPRNRNTLRGILRWAQRALYGVGVVLLAWCAWVMVDARVFENRALDRILDARRPPIALPGAPPAAPGVPADQVRSGSLIGRIEIPRLGLSDVVMEGTDAETLRRAVGHIAETPLPGQPGNTAISGHRDTFFRPLRKIQRNDLITLTTLQGEYVYRVVSTSVVEPSDVSVLNSNGGEELTLITCYPFYFVGAAPHRFVVQAERVDQMALAR